MHVGCDCCGSSEKDATGNSLFVTRIPAEPRKNPGRDGDDDGGVNGEAVGRQATGGGRRLQHRSLPEGPADSNRAHLRPEQRVRISKVRTTDMKKKKKKKNDDVNLTKFLIQSCQSFEWQFHFMASSYIAL